MNDFSKKKVILPHTSAYVYNITTRQQHIITKTRLPGFFLTLTATLLLGSAILLGLTPWPILKARLWDGKAIENITWNNTMHLIGNASTHLSPATKTLCRSLCNE